MYWWDYIMMYPYETAAVLLAIFGGYWLWLQLSKFWKKPLYVTHYGKWRIHRYTGRIVDMEGRSLLPRRTMGLNPLFVKGIEGREFKCKIKIPGQPKRDLFMHTTDLVRVEWRRVIMNKKYLVWLPEIAAYKLTDVRPTAYQLNPHNLEKFYVYKLDSIDLKANKAAVAAPPVIHNSLLQQHLPLEFGEYEEALDERLSETTTFMFDEQEVGDYELIEKIEEEEYERDIKEEDEELEELREQRELREQKEQQKQEKRRKRKEE